MSRGVTTGLCFHCNRNPYLIFINILTDNKPLNIQQTNIYQDILLSEFSMRCLCAALGLVVSGWTSRDSGLSLALVRPWVRIILSFLPQSDQRQYLDI